MISKWARYLYNILKYRDSTLLELHSAVTMIWLGLWLALPLNTFSSPTFAIMRQITSEMVWSYVFGFVGSVYASSIVLQKYNTRRLACIVAAGMWASLGTTFLVANASSVGVVIFYILAIECMWVRIRVMLR